MHLRWHLSSEVMGSAIIKLLIKPHEVSYDPWQRHREVMSKGLPRAQDLLPLSRMWDRVLPLLCA